MGSELAACPVCGKAVFENHAEVFCEDELCVYMSATVEIHNTLARRAEIGRLVEDVLSKTGYFQVEEESDEHGRMYDVRTQERSSYTDTLLDALRELAAEQATTVCKACGGSGDNRGGDCPKCDGTGIGGSDDD